MSVLVRQQPNGLLDVDFNGIGAGCVFAYVPAIGHVDLVTKKLLTITGTLNVGKVLTRNGIAIKEAITSAPYVTATVNAGAVYSVMSFGCYSDTWYGVLIDGFNESAQQSLIYRIWGGPNQFLPLNTSDGLGSVAQSATQTAAQTASGCFSGGTTDAAGNIEAWTGASKATGSNSPLRNLHSVKIYFNYTSLMVATHVVAIWKRKLSGGEVVALEANPWQLFLPVRRRRLIFPGPNLVRGYSR